MVSFYFKANFLLCIFLILFSMSKIISFVSRAFEDAIDLIEFAIYFFFTPSVYFGKNFILL